MYIIQKNWYNTQEKKDKTVTNNIDGRSKVLYNQNYTLKSVKWYCSIDVNRGGKKGVIL